MEPISNKQSTAEPVSPAPIKAIPRVNVSSDGLRAELTVEPPLHGGAGITGEEIRLFLLANKITHGVLDEILAGWDRHPQYNQPIEIAKGQAAVDGAPATLDYKVRLGKDYRPRENPDGTVDYKDMGIIQNILANEVLCVKTPATPGTPGTSVYGVILQPRPGRDLLLPMGKGTKASEDQLQLLAECDGQVDLYGGKLHVHNTFTVNGDVCNATGNINFVGNVIVHGNVLTGFAVQASGNVTVNGCVEDARVTAGGNIVLKEGIQGGEQGSVQAGGFIKSKYIQNGHVRAEGDVEATFIQHSHVQSGGSVNVVGAKGTLAGGKVVARNAINGVFVGSRNSHTLTVLEVGNNPATIERKKQLLEDIEKASSQMASLQQAITMLEAMEREDRISDDRREALNQARSVYQVLSENTKSQREENVAVDEELKTLGFGLINIRQAAYPGVRIVIGSEQMVLENTYNHTTFTRGEDGISAGPFRG